MSAVINLLRGPSNSGSPFIWIPRVGSSKLNTISHHRACHEEEKLKKYPVQQKTEIIDLSQKKNGFEKIDIKSPCLIGI